MFLIKHVHLPTVWLCRHSTYGVITSSRHQFPDVRDSSLLRIHSSSMLPVPFGIEGVRDRLRELRGDSKTEVGYVSVAWRSYVASRPLRQHVPSSCIFPDSEACGSVRNLILFWFSRTGDFFAAIRRQLHVPFQQKAMVSRACIEETTIALPTMPRLLLPCTRPNMPRHGTGDGTRTKPKLLPDP